MVLHAVIQPLSCLMENITKYPSINVFIISNIFFDTSDVIIVELQRTSQITIDRARRDIIITYFYQSLHTKRIFLLGSRIPYDYLMGRNKRKLFYRVITLYKQLEHKPAHLTTLTTFCAIIIKDCNIFRPL